MKYNSLLSISLVILFLISIFSVLISNDEPLEANLNSISNDTIQYTDNHTILEIGPSSRKAILELPGGHNVSPSFQALENTFLRRGFGSST